MTLRLVVQLDDRVLRFPLAPGELVLGSAPEADLKVSHFTVSRRHARLLVGEHGIEIEDLGSTNGTFHDGQRMEQPFQLSPAQTATFGAVEASLEEVSADDLEAAVVVESRSGPVSIEDESGAAHTPPTASLGAVKRFTLEHLPALLHTLARRASVEETAQAVGSALFATIPCLVVEIVSTTTAGESVVFSADRRGTLRREPLEVTAGNDLKLRVTFASASQERGYAALVHVGATIVSLASAPDPAREGSRPPDVAPAVPRPASLAPAVQRIYADAARVARGDISILVRGESGTGKEVLARYVHEASPRRDAAFVPLNCAALPRDLLEAEVFGIERGTATGVDARPGKFELADGGTLFLDEIGDMALETQAKILRALQEGEVYRLGARQPRAARVRIISATNRDLDAMLASGAFRTDLYHRIADWEVELPPLRERSVDIPNLAAHFLAREARRRGLTDVGISRAAMETLQAYHWPGNIRQLEREMARTALFLEDGQLVERSLLTRMVRSPADGSPATTLAAILETAERRALQSAIEATGGNIREAAKRLAIARSTIYRRMAALGLDDAG